MIGIVLTPANAGTAPLVNPLRPSGSLYETIPRQWSVWTDNSILSSGRLTLVGIWLPGSTTITSITFVSGGTALSAGTNQVFGLFDGATAHEGGSNYALLRSTADDTSTAWGTNTAKTLSLTSTYTTVSNGMFYLGILVAAGTPPTLRSFSGSNGGVHSIAPVIHGTSNTGLTAMPATANAPSAVNSVPYAYVS